METRKDINERTPVIGDVIAYPQTFGGKRYLKKGVICNIGDKGNPVVERETTRWNNSSRTVEHITIKCGVVVPFVII